MNRKPDVFFILACVVAVGVLMTGFITSDKTQAAVSISEGLIR